MATSKEFIEKLFVKLNSLNVIAKKMFGEYMIYIDSKPVLLVCDEKVFVKKTEQANKLLSNCEQGFPYENAKAHYVLNPDSVDFISIVKTLTA